MLAAKSWSIDVSSANRSSETTESNGRTFEGRWPPRTHVIITWRRLLHSVLRSGGNLMTRIYDGQGQIEVMRVVE